MKPEDEQSPHASEERRIEEEYIARLAAILRHSGELVNLSDSDGQMVFLNEAGCQAMGISPEDVRSTSVFQVLPEHLRERVRMELIPTLLTKGCWEGELQYLHQKTGAVIDVETRLFVIDGGQTGHRKYFANVSFDVSQRKRTEKALRENEERLRAVTTNIPGVVYQFRTKDDGTYEIGYASDRMMELFEIPPDSVDRFQLFIDRIHPEDRERFLQSIRRAVATLSKWSFEGRYVKASGEVTWFRGNSTPIRNKDHVVFNGILIEDTERITTETGFRQLANLNQTILDNVIVGITCLKGRKIQWVNRYLTELFGYAEEELIGKSVAMFYPNEGSFEEAGVELYKPITEGRVSSREWRLKKRDGSLFWVNIVGKAINPQEPDQGSIWMLHDIDESRRLDDARKRLEQQLFQSQKLDAIGTLAGGIAHDFNNILSGILGFTDLALLDCGDSDIRQSLEQILAGVIRARDLVRQILTFSRRAETELTEVAPKYILKEALKLLRASIPSTIEFRVTVTSDAVILADPTQLHQVVVNLCTNAAYAMKNGQGILEVGLEDIEVDDEFIRVHPGLQPGRHVQLSVTDSGCGIEPQHLSQIFEPFFTTKRHGEGTGLGLSVVHGIVTSFKGVVTVYSELGKGTTFNVILPASKADHAAEKRASESPIPRGSERIMLVDDELPILEATRLMLTRLGYSVETFSDGVSACQAFGQEPQRYDLVITDLTMPRLTGIEFAGSLRAIRADIPIILCSGFVQRNIEETANKAGIGVVLRKPVGTAEIATAIRRVLRPS